MTDRRNLGDCMKDSTFGGAIQSRGRSQSRGGMIKKVFLGGTPLKGLKRRQIQAPWAVLAHNPWVEARLLRECKLEGRAQKQRFTRAKHWKFGSPVHSDRVVNSHQAIRR